MASLIHLTGDAMSHHTLRTMANTAVLRSTPVGITTKQRAAVYEALGQLTLLGHDDAAGVIKVLVRELDKACDVVSVLRATITAPTMTPPTNTTATEVIGSHKTPYVWDDGMYWPNELTEQS